MTTCSRQYDGMTSIGVIMARHDRIASGSMSKHLKTTAIKGLIVGSFIAVIGLQGAAPASSKERGARIGWHVRQPARFIVSGVLRQDGAKDVIKPIHAIVTADDENADIAMFSGTARKQYPGYTLIATLASPVPAAGTCENSI
ncbi:hypothetical protein [Paraburkholderia kirstenboschensis]|uniref:hypothetical protein n=2 Tax=Paraburkholderia kirstenboschensis TaxID=1245436 RepID=UPI001F31B33E|nr:hypothetical protein [Paraburkholderia kirstenboschensis]